MSSTTSRKNPTPPAAIPIMAPVLRIAGQGRRKENKEGRGGGGGGGGKMSKRSKGEGGRQENMLRREMIRQLLNHHSTLTGNQWLP